MIKQRFSLESWLNVLLYLGFIIIILLMVTSLTISIESASSIKSHSQTLHSRQIQKTVNLLKLEQYLTLSFSQLSTYLTTNLETDKIKFNDHTYILTALDTFYDVYMIQSINETSVIILKGDEVLTLFIDEMVQD